MNVAQVFIQTLLSKNVRNATRLVPCVKTLPIDALFVPQVPIESMITNVSKSVPRDILGMMRVGCAYMNHLRMYKHRTLAIIAHGINTLMSIIKPATSATPAVKLVMGNMKPIVSLAQEGGISGLKKLHPLIDSVSHVTKQPCSMALQETVSSVVVMV